MKQLPAATADATFPPNEGFQYFENGGRHAFRHRSEEFELVNAWWLAEAALLSYAEGPFAGPAFQAAGLRVEGAQPFSGPSTQCYVVHTQDFVIVAFRGTQVVKPGLKDPLDQVIRSVAHDLLADAKFLLVDFKPGGRVHRGFQDGLDEIWGSDVEPYLRRLQSENPARTFWFTGHSLGAALATLGAARFGDVQGLYTFGSPLVGDEKFAKSFRVKNAYRFVHHRDPITRMALVGPQEPLGFARYQHVGQLKYIDSDGVLHDAVVGNALERLAEGARENFGFLVHELESLMSGGVLELPTPELNDHAPLFYALHVWNNYERSLAH
jgi:alpha/beta superfamily hydrolase